MIKLFVGVSVFVSVLFAAQPVNGAEFRTGAGLTMEKFIEQAEMRSFTWDEHGTVWLLSTRDNRLMLSTAAKGGIVQTMGSFERRGNERPGLLVHANRVFVSDGDAIRRFEIRGKYLAEKTALIPPGNLFPLQTRVTALNWSPLGQICFQYHSAAKKETGVGRVANPAERWDVVAKGIDGDLVFDLIGLPVASDASHLFRLALGLDYDRGLENYTKKDLAIPVDQVGLKPSAMVVHPGGNWPEENRGSWIVFDNATSALQQFKEEEEQLRYSRMLVELDRESSVDDLQIGPDGAIWLLIDKRDEEQATAIYRVRPGESGKDSAMDVGKLETAELIELLKHRNSWQRDTALRVLNDRDELRNLRGLHPGSGLHNLANEKSASSIARTYALLSLHRLALLDETLLENMADDSERSLRIWAALLFGERNYPTGVAFEKLMKLAKNSDISIRMAAAVAARQFVSGSLGVDTAPRAMPIREVYTGGILSTLWFSTEQSRSPAFDLLFWNAVRPIAAYDSAHPMGFLNGDREEGLPIAYWIAGLICQEIAQQDDPLKQEDAMLMVGELKATNHRMILAALQGLKKGTPNRRVAATEKSRNVLKKLAQHENCEIAGLGKEVLAAWIDAPPAER